MNALIFCATEEDRGLYERYGASGIRLDFEPGDLTLQTVERAKGHEAVVILTRCGIDREMARRLRENGVRFVLTRSAGYDHMDIEAMRAEGLKGANVSLYSPNAIAEYVCMAVLMLLRRAKRQEAMIRRGDFTLNGIRGRELRNMTVGVVGAGRIGFETLKIMKGFTDRLLVCDQWERPEVKAIAAYVPLERLYAESDIVIFHCPLTEDNYRMVNRASILKMKDGVILVNPARGGLWDYEAVRDGLGTGKIAAVAFDVYETEKEYLRKKISPEQLADPLLAELIREENVIYTAHSAFYTDTAVENMIEVTVENLKEYAAGESCRNELTDR